MKYSNRTFHKGFVFPTG